MIVSIASPIAVNKCAVYREADLLIIKSFNFFNPNQIIQLFNTKQIIQLFNPNQIIQLFNPNRIYSLKK